MRKIRNLYLAELLMQLHFTPLDKRKKQLDAAEKFLFSLEPDREYPAEFVCYKITGYRLESLVDKEPVKGSDLAEDLKIFMAKLSALAAPLVSNMPEKIYTIEQLSKTLGVSTKTINRWRKNDLIARKYIFEDRKKKFGFSQSVVDEFLKKNPGLISNAKNFTQLTNKEKQQVINYARRLGAKTNLSCYQIIEKIAKKIQRAHETIRYLLANYEKTYPDKPIFDKPSAQITVGQAIEVYKLFKNGATVAELMERFGRSKSTIYRIINRRRAKTLPAKKIEFIPSGEFKKDDAFEKILGEQKFSMSGLQGGETLKPAGSSLPQYLQTLRQMPLLKRNLEIELFCRYNFLKFLAHQLCSQLNINNPSGSELNKIEKYRAWAEQIKKVIIEANLRLVVSIARKHNKDDTGLLDWVSEGNFSLMRAVEKFDYTRDVRFATYASLAIAKDFARKIPAEARRLDKPGAVSMANISRDLRISQTADFSAIDRARKSLIQVIKNNLDDREQYIIIYHFGLTGTLIRKDKKTLKEIGEHLGLTKERVRQLELIALQKLKRSLSIEEFELLTG